MKNELESKQDWPEFLAAEHPLLQNLQATLFNQLTKEKEKLFEEFLKAKNQLQSIEQEKIDIGVLLYDQQQRLLSIQEQSAKQIQTIEQLNKEKMTQNLSVQKQEKFVEQIEQETQSLNQQILERIKEVSKQTQSIQQLEYIQQKKKDETLVKQREKNIVNENLYKEQKLKNWQDFIILQITEDQNRLQEEIQILKHQKDMQQKEYEGIKRHLRHSQNELEKIMNNKKILSQNLQKISIELEEKNKALQLAKNRVEAEKKVLILNENQIHAYLKELKELTDEKENITIQIGSLDKETKALKKISQKIQEKINKKQLKNDMLQQSIQRSEEEIKQIENDKNQIVRDSNLIEGELLKLQEQIRKKHGEMITAVSGQKQEEKNNQQIIKQILETKVQIDKQENENDLIDNTIGRFQMEILDLEAQTESLQIQIQDKKQRLEKKEEQIQIKEKIIKELSDQNDRKMSDIAKYNKEFEKATQKIQIMSNNKTEQELMLLEQEQSDFKDKRKQLEIEFIWSQTKAVDKEIQTQQQQEKYYEGQKKVAILSKKKERLLMEYDQTEDQIQKQNYIMKKQENDMRKLNEYLAHFWSKHKELDNQTYDTNSEFGEILVQMESTVVQLETQIQKVKEEKQQILENIIENERQILLFEKKISLEKEMQEALDPNIGKKDIASLEKELHLKKLALQEIRIKQENVVMEIEKVVNKKTLIDLKYQKNNNFQTKLSMTKKMQNYQGKVGQNSVAKNIQLIKKDLQEKTRVFKDLEAQFQIQSQQLNNLEQELLLDKETLQWLQKEHQETQQKIQVAKIEKNFDVFEIFKLQKMALYLQTIFEQGKIKNLKESQLKILFEEKQRVQNLYLEINNILQDIAELKVAQETFEQFYNKNTDLN